MRLKIKKNKYDFNFKRLIITIVKTENFSFLEVKYQKFKKSSIFAYLRLKLKHNYLSKFI